MKTDMRQNEFYKNYKEVIEEDWKSTLGKGLAMGAIGASTALGGMSAPHTKEVNRKELSIIDNQIKQKIDNLIQAIAQQESGHLNNPNYAVGDNGRAFGKYQIHVEVIKDVNKVFKTNYKHKDMFDPYKSEKVLKLYLEHYGRIFVKKHKRLPTNKELAAIWNGGPNGYKKSKARIYADKVLKFLNV